MQYQHTPYRNPQRKQPHTNVVTVGGEGIVIVNPDEALLRVGVTTERPNLQVAQQENADVSNRIVFALHQLGIPPQNIQTSQYVVRPQYNYVDGIQTLRGYSVEHFFQVLVNDLTIIGDLYRVAIESGANYTEDLQFRISNPEQFEKQALKKAILHAKGKAIEIAQTIGVTLNPIPIIVTEELKQQIQPFQGSYQSFSAAVPPIQSGQIILHSFVTATFEYF
ncbi:SIMPL domain-containing protein [Metabacillus malikii]|uniref:Uncharacterized protein YggE n=1 Tax=Metabacillus malikii TaxID=1504265 RepID=A0ABT9ZIC4_9BACI|nr:SIMPL domain-containing protein [Metabacillus malikii]MDQ0232032.1 uncharacterized protein YggE [Metabacillus malikii]